MKTADRTMSAVQDRINDNHNDYDKGQYEPVLVTVGKKDYVYVPALYLPTPLRAGNGMVDKVKVDGCIF